MGVRPGRFVVKTKRELHAIDLAIIAFLMILEVELEEKGDWEIWGKIFPILSNSKGIDIELDEKSEGYQVTIHPVGWGSGSSIQFQILSICGSWHITSGAILLYGFAGLLSSAGVEHPSIPFRYESFPSPKIFSIEFGGEWKKVAKK